MSDGERQAVSGNGMATGADRWLVPSADRNRVARNAFAWHALIGLACVVAGGLVAAVTGPLDWALGSWLAAYLVLVAGVAQAAIGAAPYYLTRSAPRAAGRPQLVAWNLGNAAVIAGTVLSNPWIVDAGGLVLLVALILALRGVAGGRGNALLQGYRVLLVLVALSVPVGLVLAHLRAG